MYTDKPESFSTGLRPTYTRHSDGEPRRHIEDHAAVEMAICSCTLKLGFALWSMCFDAELADLGTPALDILQEIDSGAFDVDLKQIDCAKPPHSISAATSYTYQRQLFGELTFCLNLRPQDPSATEHRAAVSSVPR